MAVVVYSLSGEGRGHATRVRAVVDALRRDHRVVILAPGDALPLLARAYRDTAVEVLPLPGLRFHYRADRRLDLGTTAAHGLLYLAGARRALGQVRGVLDRARPDLCVSDFEPLLPRAARAAGVPVVSLDHQHFLLHCDLEALPGWLRRKTHLMRAVVRAYCPRPSHTVVSSFYAPPLRRGTRSVTQSGVLLREAVRGAAPTAGDHLVAYLRRFASDAVLAALAATGREVRVYGLGERATQGRLQFEPVSEEGFLTDLSSCQALVSTAGNQLVGEALALGKPVFALPEAGNYEQFVNAHYLAAMGGGAWAPLEQVRRDQLVAFLDRLDRYRGAVHPDSVVGNEAALAVVRRFLPCRDVASARPAFRPALDPALRAASG